MKKYNSVYHFGFEVSHDEDDASDLTYADLRNALQEELDRLDSTHPELLDADTFDGPSFTTENETGKL